MCTLLRQILFFVLTALVVPMVALATPPTTEPLVFDETFVYAPGTDENPCSFELTYRNEGTYLVTTHYDSSGLQYVSSHAALISSRPTPRTAKPSRPAPPPASTSISRPIPSSGPATSVTSPSRVEASSSRRQVAL